MCVREREREGGGGGLGEAGRSKCKKVKAAEADRIDNSSSVYANSCQDLFGEVKAQNLLSIHCKFQLKQARPSYDL